MNRFVAVLLLLGSLGIAQAADIPTPPSPPFLANLPALATWRMNFHPDGKLKDKGAASTPASPGPRTLSDITITKSQTIRKIVETWSDGSENEKWLYRGIQMDLPPGSETVRVLIFEALPDPSSMSASDFGRTDFPELSWIEKGMFQGEVEKNGVKCLYFESRPSQDHAAPSTPTKKVWIAQGSKLPVAFDDGRRQRVYEFLPPPQAPLTLPAPFAWELDRMSAAMQAQQKHRMK